MKPIKRTFIYLCFALLCAATLSGCKKNADMPFTLEELKAANSSEKISESCDALHIKDNLSGTRASLGAETFSHDIYVTKADASGAYVNVYMTDSSGEETYISNGRSYVRLADNEYLSMFYLDGYYETIMMPSYNMFNKSLVEIQDIEKVTDFKEENGAYILTTQADFSEATEAYKAYLDYYWGISDKKGMNVYTIDKETLFITSVKQYYKNGTKPVLYYSVEQEKNVSHAPPDFASELTNPQQTKNITVIIDKGSEKERTLTFTAALNSLVDFNSTVIYNKYTDEQCTVAYDYINTPENDFTLYFLSVKN